MKLSEAIRIGIKYKPNQCTKNYFGDNDSACVIGAALTGLWESEENTTLRQQFESIGKMIARVTNTPYEMITTIMYYNDVFGYSREKIADKLERNGY